MGQTMSHQTSYITLINSSFRNGLDFIELLARRAIESFQHHKLLSMLLGTLHNFMERYFWWRPNLHHQTKKNWAGAHVHISCTGPCSWCWKVLCTLWEEKSSHQHNPVTNPLTYNRDLPACRHTYWFNSATNVIGITNHCFNTEFKAHAIRQNSCLPLLKWSRTWD